MRPGQPADLFHMFPGERGKAAPNPQNKTLKKKNPKRQRQLAGVGFQESCRESTSAEKTWLHSHVYVFISFVRGRLITGTSHFHRTEMFYIVTSYEVTQL